MEPILQKQAPTWTTAGPEYWQIMKGPFFDRFDKYGYQGLRSAVLALSRTNDVCYAAIADCNNREYIDILLRRTELGATLDSISAQLVLAGRPAITPAMRDAILQTPTTDYERHIKDLPQPDGA